MIKNIYAIFFGGCAVIGALLYGYDATYFSGIQAMPIFLNDFGNTMDPATGEKTLTDTLRSVLSSMIQVGEMVGSLSATFIGSRLGRKYTIATAYVIVCLGAVLQTCSKNLAVFIVGRTILGMGIGILSNAVPLYLSEVPPKSLRGAMVGSWQFAIDFGKVIGACVDEGGRHINNTAAYRVPIMIHAVIPLVYFAVMWYLPESPRWLMRRDKQDAAAKALVKVHKEDKNYDPSSDIAEMMEDVARDNNSDGGWWDMVADPIERRKLLCTVGMMAGQQITGIQFISSYSTVFVESVGLKDPFLISIMIYCIQTVGAFISLFLVDRFGRRPLLLPTTLLMVLQMLVVGCLDIHQPRNQASNNGIVAMITLFSFTFCLAAGPLTWVVATETCVGRNRNRIMTLGTFAFWLMAWVVTFTMPYMYTAMGPKLCFIYSGTCAAYLLFIYFCIGETVGKSMEEISLLFNTRIPIKKWKNYKFNETDYQLDAEKGKFTVIIHEDNS